MINASYYNILFKRRSVHNFKRSGDMTAPETAAMQALIDSVIPLFP